MTVDPFNGGPTDTLYSTPMPADQRRAALAVMRRFRGGPDMTIVLAALGLETVAADMLNRRSGAKRLSGPQSPTEGRGLHAAPERPENPPTTASGQVLTHAMARRAAAITRARQIIANAPTTEAPPVDNQGRPVKRCGKRLHVRTEANSRTQRDGVHRCTDCVQLVRARATIRELAGEGT